MVELVFVSFNFKAHDPVRIFVFQNWSSIMRRFRLTQREWDPVNWWHTEEMYCLVLLLYLLLDYSLGKLVGCLEGYYSRQKVCLTRMHSSSMRTVRCSSGPGRGGGVCPEGGVCPGGSALGGVHPPPWTEFVTHACENITFLQLRLQMVIILSVPSDFWN